MHRRFRISLALLALLVAVFAAGCGGDQVSKAEYEDEIEKVMTDVKESNVFSGGQPKAADLQKGADVIDEAAKELDEITPPDEVKSLHQDLVEGVGEFGDLLGQMVPILAKVEKNPAAAKTEAPKLQGIQKDFTATTEKLQKTIDGFEDKGYKTNAG